MAGKRNRNIDYAAIEHDFMNLDPQPTLGDLAVKHGVNINTLRNHSSRHDWISRRRGLGVSVMRNTEVRDMIPVGAKLPEVPTTGGPGDLEVSRDAMKRVLQALSAVWADDQLKILSIIQKNLKAAARNSTKPDDLKMCVQMLTAVNKLRKDILGIGDEEEAQEHRPASTDTDAEMQRLLAIQEENDGS